ncbi:hypothetical protein B9T54_16295 [Leptospira borgpetersenii serovar Hardjo-bovis]|nr:hypothetical protein B9T54_16295 [Leptospira borgpetersenii serovar Hardjo-bovis]
MVIYEFSNRFYHWNTFVEVPTSEFLRRDLRFCPSFGTRVRKFGQAHLASKGYTALKLKCRSIWIAA